jgi:hypothetical protein
MLVQISYNDFYPGRTKILKIGQSSIYELIKARLSLNGLPWKLNTVTYRKSLPDVTYMAEEARGLRVGFL